MAQAFGGHGRPRSGASRVPYDVAGVILAIGLRGGARVGLRVPTEAKQMSNQANAWRLATPRVANLETHANTSTVPHQGLVGSCGCHPGAASRSVESGRRRCVPQRI